jgi:Transglycosylase SLT domain
MSRPLLHAVVLGVLVAMLLPASPAAARRRTYRNAPRAAAPRAPKIVVPKEPVFPATVSEQLVGQLVAVSRVAPKPNPKDPESWRRWGNAHPWDQAVAVRAVADSLSTARASIALSSAILAIARVESGFNPWAKNPKSTACGIFQFIRATWTPYGGDHGYCTDPGMNAAAGVKHLNGIFHRHVRKTLPPLAELPNDLQRAEWIYRGMYAFHFHGLASRDAVQGGLIDSQLPAENNIQHLHNYFALLKRATYVPPRAVRKAPARPRQRWKRGRALMRAS